MPLLLFTDYSSSLVDRRFQINVSSGGMYTQRLDSGDLQSTKVEPFDGARVYAHQKRQLVEWTAHLARTVPASKVPGVFSCHPGMFVPGTVSTIYSAPVHDDPPIYLPNSHSPIR